MRTVQKLVSAIALCVIFGGLRYAYGRERLRKTDLHAWYVEDNNRFFRGELADAEVRWDRLVEEEALGTTQGYDDGTFFVRLDHYQSEAEARATLRHELCHVQTWSEVPLHGPKFQACVKRLHGFGVEVE